MYVHRMNYRACACITLRAPEVDCRASVGLVRPCKIRCEQSVPWSITVEKLFGGHIAQLRGPTPLRPHALSSVMTWVKLIVLAAVGLANVEAAPTREGVLTHEGAVAATARKQLFSSTPTPPDSDTGDPDRCPLPTNTVEETVAAILDAVSRLDIPCIVYYALHGSTSPDGFTACMLTAVRAYIESRDPIQGLRQLLRDLRSCIAGAPEVRSCSSSPPSPMLQLPAFSHAIPLTPAPSP